MIARRPDSRGSEQDGFVLIGVIVIVLALTILGISLFGLSGYEAQFLGASTNGSRAFYAAEGGIDRAKLALSATSDLGAAGINLPPGVIYTVARQGSDSTTALDWNDTTRVEIVTTAEVNGIRRTIEASFRPNRDRTLYTDLIATTGKIYIRHDPTNIPYPVIRPLNILTGSLRHNDVSNAASPPSATGPFTDEGGGVPTPQVPLYFANWTPFSIGAPLYTVGNPNRYRFNVPADGFAHFVDGSPGPGNGFGLWNPSGQEIQFEVSGGGTAVWMLPNGGRFDQRVTVTGTASDRLIIVAGITGDAEFVPRTGVNTGLWFNGGLNSPNVPVILVSNGTIAIEHFNSFNLGNNINYLAVFASAFLVARHVNGFPISVMTHDKDMDNGILNPMYTDALLPNTLPGTAQDFIPIAGSWREIRQ